MEALRNSLKLRTQHANRTAAKNIKRKRRA